MAIEHEPPQEQTLPNARDIMWGVIHHDDDPPGPEYCRLRQLTQRNIGLLALQSCPPEPVETRERWRKLGRTVIAGSTPYASARLINRQNSHKASPNLRFDYTGGEPYELVHKLYSLSQTEGRDLVLDDPPKWSQTMAASSLQMEQAVFKPNGSDRRGYSWGRKFAVSPNAPFPEKTSIHEMAHIDLGHTTDSIRYYQERRGEIEAEAEITTCVVLNHISEFDFDMWDYMLDYITGWQKENRPSLHHFDRILSASTRIIRAGYPSDGTNRSL